MRALRRSPMFAMVSIATLALAIAANAVTFALVKAVLIDPLPYGHPDRLVTIVEADGRATHPETISAATFADIVRESTAFSQLALWADAAIRPTDGVDGEMIRGVRVSTNYFDTLSVPMFLGRAFEAGDADRLSVILTYGTWRERFGGDPTVVGRVVPTIEGGYTIVGVTPPAFQPLHMSNPAELPRVFMPLPSGTTRSTCRATMCRGMRAIGRLGDSATVAGARTELASLARDWVRRYPAQLPDDETMIVTPLEADIVGLFGAAVSMLEAAAVLLLALASVNVAMLMIARIVSRDSEMAIRAALGATRLRLVGELIAEQALIAGFASIAGAALAWAAMRAIVRNADPNLPRLATLTPDPSRLAAGIAVSLFAAAAFAAVPGIVASRRIADRLRARGGASPRTTRWRGLVAAQVGMAATLAVLVGMLGHSYIRLAQVDPGFEPRNVLTLSLLPAGIRDSLSYFDAVAERARRIPGVEGVAYASTLPLSHAATSTMFVREQPLANDADAPLANVYLASTNYFDVMRVRVLRGRGFWRGDAATTAPVAVVSETASRALFGGADPIGQHIQLGAHADAAPWATVVGIVADVHQYGLDSSGDAAVYRPFSQFMTQGWASLVVRSTIPSERIEADLRQAMRDVDPRQPIFHLQPMSRYIELSMAQRTFTLAMVAAFGILAIVLALAGVYAVVSFSIEQRRREVALRLALGGEPRVVCRRMLGEVLAAAGAGISIGAAVAIVSVRAIAALLFGVSSADVSTLLVMSALMAAGALAAAYRPIARAAQIDLASALRAE